MDKNGGTLTKGKPSNTYSWLIKFLNESANTFTSQFSVLEDVAE
jgi:hypothetical protein